MNNSKLIVASDKETLDFARKYYPTDYTSRGKYASLFHHFFHNSKSLPCFLFNSTAQHHEDIKNIELMLRRKKIRGRELSIIIFDAHTDMYHYSNHELLSVQGEVNMANWILELLKRGYDDISLVGVSDFTRSSPEIKDREYFRFNDKVNFFLGRDFDRTKDFKEDSFYKIRLMKVEDFFKKSLRDYAFISLDCDVSEDFAGHPMTQYTGYRGKTKLNEVIEITSHIRDKAQIIGLSLYGIYGMGLFSTFLEKREVVKEVLDSI